MSRSVEPASLQIELLGGLRVTVRGQAVPAEQWSRRKPAAIVKLLTLAPGHRLHRERPRNLGLVATAQNGAATPAAVAVA